MPGLSSKGFRWPLDLVYAQQQPSRTVLGYSTDGRVYHPVPSLQPAQLPSGTAVGWYVDSSNLTHVLTRTPFQLALFKQGAWGDPTYTSPNGPTLATQTPFQALPHPADHSLLLLTRLAVHVAGPPVRLRNRPAPAPVAILGKGSRFGARLKAGGFRSCRPIAGSPGPMQVRLRLNARSLRPRLVPPPRRRRRSVGTAQPPHAPLPLR